MGHHLSRKPVPFQCLTTLTVDKLFAQKLFANVLSEALLVQLCAFQHVPSSPFTSAVGLLWTC